MSLTLPSFATQDFALTPEAAQPHLVVTQLYPSSPGSWMSTPCYDLAEFDSDNSHTVMSNSPVYDIVYVVPVDMFSATSRFVPLIPQGSPVSTEVVDRGVVESPEFDAVVVPSDMLTITHHSTPGCHRYLRRLWTGCPTSAQW